jgi:hypothetical protein
MTKLLKEGLPCENDSVQAILGGALETPRPLQRKKHSPAPPRADDAPEKLAAAFHRGGRLNHHRLDFS